MKGCAVVAVLSLSLASFDVRAEAAPTAETQQAQTGTVRLERVALEFAGAIVGSLGAAVVAFAALDGADAFHAISPGWNPWVVPSILSAAVWAGASIVAIGGARIIERRPPMLGSMIGALIGTAVLFAISSPINPGIVLVPGGELPLPPLLFAIALFMPPIVGALLGIELDFVFRSKSTAGISAQVLPQIGPRGEGHVAIVGSF